MSGPAGRVQAGEPEDPPLRLEPGKAALAGELQLREPTQQPQPIPATPCLHTSPLRSRCSALAGGSKPLRGQGVWELPSSPPAPGCLPPAAPLPPQRASSGVFLELFYLSVLEH